MYNKPTLGFLKTTEFDLFPCYYACNVILPPHEPDLPE